MVNDRLGEIDARAVNSIPLGVTADGEPVVARVGSYGPYRRSAARQSREHPRRHRARRAHGRARPSSSSTRPEVIGSVGTDPETGLPCSPKPAASDRTCSSVELEDGPKDKPKTASLLSSMSLETVTLDEALELLSLPRVVGVDPADGEEITVQNGRFGPVPQEGQRQPQPRRRGAAVHASRSTRRC